MIKIKRNVKRGERRNLGIKRSSKARKEHGLRNFAAKVSRSENRLPLRNGFVAVHPPLRKFSQLCRGPLAYECHFAAKYTSFATAKWLQAFHTLKILHFAAETQFRRVFHSCETTLWHMSAISQSRTLISQL